MVNRAVWFREVNRLVLVTDPGNDVITCHVKATCPMKRRYSDKVIGVKLTSHMTRHGLLLNTLH
jgi:hypothetical protein